MKRWLDGGIEGEKVCWWCMRLGAKPVVLADGSSHNISVHERERGLKS